MSNFFKKFLGNQRGEAGDEDKWFDSLPEGVQDWDEVKNSDSADKFWTQMTDMRSHLGQSIRIPGEDAGEEDVKTFHAKLQDKVPGLIPTPNLEDTDGVAAIFGQLGRPEKADGYTVPKFETDVELDMSPVDMFRPIAHKANVTQQQWNIIVGEMTKGNIEIATVGEQNRKTQLNQLKTEWGDTYDNNLAAVKGLLKVTEAPTPLSMSFEKGKVDDPTLKWLFEVTKALGGNEAINLALDKNKQEGKVTPAEARSQIDEMLSNKKHAYWNKGSVAHKDAIVKMVQLQALANPEPARV